jgi:hypothetical protein
MAVLCGIWSMDLIDDRRLCSHTKVHGKRVCGESRESVYELSEPNLAHCPWCHRGAPREARNPSVPCLAHKVHIRNANLLRHCAPHPVCPHQQPASHPSPILQLHCWPPAGAPDVYSRHCGVQDNVQRVRGVVEDLLEPLAADSDELRHASGALVK